MHGYTSGVADDVHDECMITCVVHDIHDEGMITLKALLTTFLMKA